MVALFALAAVLLASPAVALEDPAELLGAPEVALSTDDACSLGAADAAEAAACSMHLLQRRGRRLSVDSPPDPAMHAASKQELEDHIAAMHPNDKEQVQTLGTEPDAIGGFLKGILLSNLPKINSAIQDAIPATVPSIATATGEESKCCIPGWDSCWCNCRATGSLKLTNMENANTLHITKVNSVTSDDTANGTLAVTINAEVKVWDMRFTGSAAGSLGACGHSMSPVHGKAVVAMNMRGIATLKGTVLLGGPKVCFNTTDLHLEIPSDDIEYTQTNVEIGGWKLLQLSGGFWNSIIMALPTSEFIDPVVVAAEPPIKKVLIEADLCI